MMSKGNVNCIGSPCKTFERTRTMWGAERAMVKRLARASRILVYRTTAMDIPQGAAPNSRNRWRPFRVCTDFNYPVSLIFVPSYFRSILFSCKFHWNFPSWLRLVLPVECVGLVDCMPSDDGSWSESKTILVISAECICGLLIHSTSDIAEDEHHQN